MKFIQILILSVNLSLAEFKRKSRLIYSVGPQYMVYDYIGYLEDSCMIIKVSAYDIKGKKT
jgi:predicted AAA+ superfamily ATPase